MKIIDHSVISELNIRPSTCVEWIRESFLAKKEAQLPPKTSLHPQGDDFFNTMPCILPSYHRYGCKIVSRIRGAEPSLNSMLILSNSTTGEVLALMDADWITAMRTGAVVALAEHLFRPFGEIEYGFLGLGNAARASLLCLLDCEPNRTFRVKLLRYKDQAEKFIQRFSDHMNVTFSIVDSPEDLIASSNVVISCVTSKDGLFCSNDNLFQQGALVIPVHTRGFQNCDLFFDKVYGDDTGHICEFKYFDKFQHYAEISDVLRNLSPGRESGEERILSYNIGLGLHDLVFASKIYPLVEDSCPDISMKKPQSKFWI